MSARITTAQLSARMDAFEAKFDALLAHLDAQAPAKATPARKAQPKAAATPKGKAAKARKAATQPKADRCLTRKNRAEFVKVAPWAKGLSTAVIAAMCLEDPALLEGTGFRIGERRQAMLEG